MDMLSDQPKDPDAVLDYVFDWKAKTNGTGDSDWLQSSEIIADFTVTPTDGVTVDLSELINGNTAVRVWLSGGTPRSVQKVACKVTTNNGIPRTDEKVGHLDIGG